LYNVGESVAWRLNVETGDVSYCSLVEHTLVCQDATKVDTLKKWSERAVHKAKKELGESKARIEGLTHRLHRARARAAELEEELVALREGCE
ncbi:MAG: hypothetical protein ACE5LL_03630, partial [Alphaproteobacteria bacterium]